MFESPTSPLDSPDFNWPTLEDTPFRSLCQLIAGTVLQRPYESFGRYIDNTGLPLISATMHHAKFPISTFGRGQLGMFFGEETPVICVDTRDLTSFYQVNDNLSILRLYVGNEDKRFVKMQMTLSEDISGPSVIDLTNLENVRANAKNALDAIWDAFSTDPDWAKKMCAKYEIWNTSNEAVIMPKLENLGAITVVGSLAGEGENIIPYNDYVVGQRAREGLEALSWQQYWDVNFDTQVPIIQYVCDVKKGISVHEVCFTQQDKQHMFQLAEEQGVDKDYLKSMESMLLNSRDHGGFSR